MKYIRKVMAAGLAIVFLIALVIGVGVIFSVRNVNVSYIDYSGSYDEEYAATRQNLNKLKGSGLLFIADGDVYEKVTSPERLKVVSYEKKFPCTVNVVVKERVECFSLQTDGGYNVYDEEGEFIRSVDDAGSQPLNTIDGCPNVLLKVTENQVADAVRLCGYLKEGLTSLRRPVESLSFEKFLELSVAKITLRSGVVIAVSKWETSSAEKIKKACEVYSKLTDLQRTEGTITVVDGKDGTGVSAKYGVQK